MKDRIVVVCTILLASGYLYATSQLPFLENVDPLGPKVFPALLGIGMVLSALLLIGEIILKKKQAHKHKEEQEPKQTKIHLLLVGGVACWTLLFFTLLEPLGYLLASSIYLFVFMAFFNRNRWRTNTIVAILFSVATFALFVKGLGVTLPKGILFSKDEMMETLAHTLNGFAVSLTPINVFLLFVGVLIGTMIGVLPGIGPAGGIALLLPVTYGMDPTAALIMLCGIYYGAMYGGSTTAILINTPGESASIMTTLDGYEMAKKGRAGAALAVAAVGSFIAGTIGIVGLSLLALPLSNFAIRFGPAEYFCLFFFAMTAVTSLTGKSFAKGMISMFIGLMISTIGLDLQSSQPRYTLGIPELRDGIDYLVIVMGLFALGEVLENVEDTLKGELSPIRIKGKLWMTGKEWGRSILPILRGGVVGFFVGVLPGTGATIASIMSYVVEKKCSKHPEEFGKGAIEGVAGPESANNASTAGAMVPLLTLGVPGSGTTAIMLGAFIMYGIQPGPFLFQKHPDLVWGLIASMYLGNVMLLILNLPLVGIFVRLLYIPVGIRLPAIIGIASIGIYSVSNSSFDLYLLLFFGMLGYAFRKLEIPAVPLVMGVVLGGMMEQSFRQAMSISGGSPLIFIHSVISASLLALAVLMAVMPIVISYMQKRGKAVGAEDEEGISI